MVRSSLTVSLLTLASSLTGVLGKSVEAESYVERVTERIVDNRWIVTFDKDADAPSLRERLIHDDIKIRKDFDYPIFKGASIETTNAETSEDLVEMLNGLSGVTIDPVKRMARSISDASPVENSENPERLHKRDPSEVDTIDPLTGLNFDSTHEMTQVSDLHKAGFRGKDVNIAIIGSGIDYLHPDLGGCFGPGCLVDRGYDFVGDDYDGFSEPVPDEDPMDCAGSGTHMAGIIAAQGKQWKFTGAAPEATLGAYKVFGCRGNVDTDVLISAFYAAYDDGAKIITSSISRPSGWSKDPLAIIIQRIIDQGVPCILPSGDDGEKGLFYASDTASAKGALAIGSVDNVNTPKLTIPSTYSIDGGSPIEFEWMKGRPYKSWGEVQGLEVFAVGFDTSATANGCSGKDYGSKPYPNLDGKVVLVRRGGCEFLRKAYIASALGAKYVIMYNDAPGTMEVYASRISKLKGVAMVTPEMGETWIKEIATGKKITLNMADPSEVIPKLSISANAKTGGSMSKFSSWGPTWDMDLRPLVSVPGGNILSTYPRAMGSYAVMSGTAMAAPLLAAIAALIGSARENFHPKVIESLLVNYASPKHISLDDGYRVSDYLVPIPQQGAGVVQAYDSAFGDIVFGNSYISFNTDDHFEEIAEFEVMNVGKTEATYKIENTPALTVFAKESQSQGDFNTIPNKMEKAYASFLFSSSEFTLGPMDRKLFMVKATPPPDLNPKELPVWSGFLTFTGSDDSKLTLPYQGMTGSLKKTPIFHESKTFLTFIPGNEAKPYKRQRHIPVRSTEFWVLPPQGAIKASGQGQARNYPAGVELPGFQIKLALGTPLLRADLIPVSQPASFFRMKKVLGLPTMGQHPSFPNQYITRGTYTHAFDGLMSDGRYVPPGEYKWLFRALRVSGDPQNPRDYSAVESTSFHITYENLVGPEITAAVRSKERPALAQVVSFMELGS
ncbi:uncharacterized protein BROUX77_002864 [Berkeleyomyces rouxiae]|uniref:uncharacterized protein n=1 Tax=Berkeleyomyces rouxiae TaxID=2035830 RepID=UPI003B7694FB